MFRKSLVVLSKNKPRTIVRDPRKKRLPAEVSHHRALTAQQQQEQQQQIQERQQMAFEPSRQNQQSIGSTMGSYALAGFGMSIGFALVGALFGGF
ncbi:unnamed protein product [Cylindrotheca closterium]|uniref:Uncharacterized protein n=1 Tax=Cylindrotheca closterium TaxID=2856 RepID=A0AAD2CD12_9STRA|nr:unnamed protein product [Cylindrotheca closterium]